MQKCTFADFAPVFLFTALVHGCRLVVAAPPDGNLSVSPAPAPASALTAANATSGAVTVVGPVTPAESRLLPIIYPAAASNYVWTLETSTDLLHWQAVATFKQGSPSGTWHVTNDAPARFWRMRGVKP